MSNEDSKTVVAQNQTGKKDRMKERNRYFVSFLRAEKKTTLKKANNELFKGTKDLFRDLYTITLCCALVKAARLQSAQQRTAMPLTCELLCLRFSSLF